METALKLLKLLKDKIKERNKTKTQIRQNMPGITEMKTYLGGDSSGKMTGNIFRVTEK